MIKPVIGIIGMGFLGREIARLEKWPAASWGTNLNHPESDSRKKPLLHQVRFDWQDSSHWERLPDESGTLILTVPPVHAQVDREIERLKTWGAWMNQNRPGYRNLVYISTTGVYPNLDGQWDEESMVEPDHDKGRLRLATERTLGEFFELRVLRPGAIYGRKRNIAERILAGKPVPSGENPVHRIHVTDLAQIARLAVVEESFPLIVNAVDLDPAPTPRVASWLLQQDFPAIPPGARLDFKDGFAARKGHKPALKRLINNRLLIDTCGYSFLFPTYKEGLPDSLK